MLLEYPFDYGVYFWDPARQLCQRLHLPSPTAFIHCLSGLTLPILPGSTPPMAQYPCAELSDAQRTVCHVQNGHLSALSTHRDSAMDFSIFFCTITTISLYKVSCLRSWPQLC